MSLEPELVIRPKGEEGRERESVSNAPVRRRGESDLGKLRAYLLLLSRFETAADVSPALLVGSRDCERWSKRRRLSVTSDVPLCLTHGMSPGVTIVFGNLALISRFNRLASTFYSLVDDDESRSSEVSLSSRDNNENQNIRSRLLFLEDPFESDALWGHVRFPRSDISFDRFEIHIDIR